MVDIPMGTTLATLPVDIYSTHTKRNFYSLCSRRERSNSHLGSILYTGTSMMFCP